MAESKNGSKVISIRFHLTTNKENTSNKRKGLKDEGSKKILILKKNYDSSVLARST